MAIRPRSGRPAAAVSLALFLAAAGPATADTSVSNVGGVEVIVSTPDQAPKAASSARRRARAEADRADSAQPAAPSTPATGRAEQVVQTAMALIGTPYVWGGSSPSGFDCSGLAWYAYSRAGVSIPRTADVQFAAGRPVAGDPLPGDLVFFQTYDYGASHVGIYVGNGWFVNAIGSDVHLASFASPYFRGRYLGARRFLS